MKTALTLTAALFLAGCGGSSSTTHCTGFKNAVDCMGGPWYDEPVTICHVKGQEWVYCVRQGS